MDQPNDKNSKVLPVGQPTQSRAFEAPAAPPLVQKMHTHVVDGPPPPPQSAPSGDATASGERRQPEPPKDGAKELFHQAKQVAVDGAKELIRDAKDATLGSYEHIKDQAVDSVVAEAVTGMGRRAQRAGRSASAFVSVNALPLALMGLGLSWLMLGSGRRQQTPRTAYGDEGDHRTAEGMRRRTRDAVDNAREHVDHAASRATELLGDARDKVMDRAGEVRSRVMQGATDARRRAVDLGHDAYDRLGRAGARVREFGSESPMAVGLFALALGIGTGLLLPSTGRENRLMGGTRDRLVGSARDTASQLGSSIKQGAGELKQAVAEQARAH